MKLNSLNYPNAAARTATVKAMDGIADAVERLDVWGDLMSEEPEYEAIHSHLVLDYKESGKQAQNKKTDQEVSENQEWYLDKLIAYASMESDEDEEAFVNALYKEKVFDLADPEELSKIADEATQRLRGRAKRPTKVADKKAA